jgi:hypothetical protein
MNERTDPQDDRPESVEDDGDAITASVDSAAHPAPKFDPKRHTIRVQGNREYLPVSARLIWFRGERPDWGIVTEPIEINYEKQFAVFLCRIFNAEGRLMATGTKMETVRGFADWLEKAETGSVGRALALCGYGTQFAPELEEGARLADSPYPMRNQEPAQNRSQGAQNQHARPYHGGGGSDAYAEPLNVRQEAYTAFAAAAFDSGFVVTMKENGENVYSELKIGSLIVRGSGVKSPPNLKGWRPPTEVIKAATDALPRMKEADAAKKSPANAAGRTYQRTAPEPAAAARSVSGGSAAYEADDEEMGDPFA